MFNTHSRWDRRFPQQQAEPGDPIEVGAVFRRGKLIPRCFVWQQRKYPITEVTYYWQDKEGEAVLHFFSVTDGVNLYQIHLNNRQMIWRLDKMEPMAA